MFYPVAPHAHQPLPAGHRINREQTPSAEAAHHSDAVQRLIAKLNQHALNSELVPDPAHDNELSNWLHVSGIHEYVGGLIEQGKSVEDIMVPTGEDPDVVAIVPFISHWVETSMRKLHRTGQLLKRQCLAEST